MIRSEITYVRNPPDSAAALAPRCTDAVSPPSRVRERDDDLLLVAARLDHVAVVRELVPAERDPQLRDRDRDDGDARDRFGRARPGREVERRDLAVEPERLLARADRGVVVLAREPCHRGERLTSAAVGEVIDGKAIAARIREEVAGEVRELGHVGLATVLVGDDAASDDLHPPEAEGRDRGRDRRAGPAPSGRDERGGAARDRRAASTRTTRSTASSSSCRSRITSTRAASSAPSTPREGRRRLPPGQRRPALPRHAGPRPGDAARDHGAPRRLEVPLDGRAGGRDRPQRDRRQARGAPAPRRRTRP